MAGQRSVVKHKYLTGKNQGVARANAHVRYIQFRGGKDKEEEPRQFFNALRDDITGREVSKAVNDQNPRGTVMHKLILSPGVQGADVKEYCREVMADLASRKGLDLEWYAVRHDNTDNPHVHIVVMGKDENGRNVRLSKDDYTKIKEAGDRYLERNRLLEREEKDKEKDKDERNPVAKFIDALKAAAKEFSRTMGRDEKDSKPESKYEQRKREREEEKAREIAALGDPVDLDEYLSKQEEKELKDQEKKEKAWKAYCKPIEVDRGANEPIRYDRASSLQALRQLEKDYADEDPRVRASMSEADNNRLGDWIREKLRDEKRVETKAEKLENIELQLDGETTGKWSKASSLEDLRKLEAMNARAEVYLDSAEQKALGNWIKDQELKQPIRIQLEPGTEPVIYDRDDSKESLQFLAKEYAKGEHWATEHISKEDYQKIRTWISEKDKPREPEKQPEDKDERLKVGDKFVSKDMDAEALSAAREELAKHPNKNKAEIERLDTWIANREKLENKTTDKKEKKSKRKLSAREKRIDRATRLDRASRWDNYHRERALKDERLKAQIANLKGQKSALNKYEKERETVDGQYSEIWGADKSAIAAGPMGAASGGARPLGANQFVKLITQAKQNWDAKQKQERESAAKTQRELANKLTEEKKTTKEPTGKEDKPITTGDKSKDDKPSEKSQLFAKEVKEDSGSTSKLETDARELDKDVKNKKKKEQDRDPRPGADKEREDPFKYDPWGRY